MPKSSVHVRAIEYFHFGAEIPITVSECIAGTKGVLSASAYVKLQVCVMKCLSASTQVEFDNIDREVLGSSGFHSVHNQERVLHISRGRQNRPPCSSTWMQGHFRVS